MKKVTTMVAAQAAKDMDMSEVSPDEEYIHQFQPEPT